MKKIISSFDELTNVQLYDLLKLRQDVFIIEQNCIYPDIDGYDKKASHLLIYEHDELAAYSRIFAPDIKYNAETSIGRIIVSPKKRGGSLGKTLIEKSINYCITKYPKSDIRIEAQAKLKNYYSKFGFIGDSDVYLVDGIDHVQMVYKAKN
ncbi:MAG: GNAT family N-acetyltransferase [Balneola sp.]|nr:GNAT family N-acetyltransferase [Balneola sp.]MBO6650000.1 GNAT family N-acetyltransferase [Balneola sp.]MBO6711650.1 GNAT family N-acetyltransferase [Balneola sp.]MBO6799846.1 GNAT family N-acetyltransferase [Balneola sp.]MBO6871089.1 GNAT family N-acetyltransferase [Balneola sp.]